MIFNISIFSAATHQVSFSIPKHLRFYWTCTDTGLMANKTFRLVHILIYQWCRWWYGKFPMPMIWVEDFQGSMIRKNLFLIFLENLQENMYVPYLLSVSDFPVVYPKETDDFQFYHTYIYDNITYIYINFTCEQL
jgi:hypothetical protein